MKDNSVLRLGGAMAILIGLAKLFASVGYLFLPPELRQTAAGPVFLPAYAANPGLLNSIFWSEALVGIFGLAVVPALAAVVHERSEGWTRWASTLALAGFVITSVGYMLSYARVPGIARAFVAGDAATKAALAVTWRSSIDLLGFWGYGAIGIWVLVVSLLALRGKDFSSILNIIGILLALLYILVPLSVMQKSATLQVGIAGLGALLAPIWYIWIGYALWHPRAEAA
jgi:hypothetical protein